MMLESRKKRRASRRPIQSAILPDMHRAYADGTLSLTWDEAREIFRQAAYYGTMDLTKPQIVAAWKAGRKRDVE